MSVTNVVTEQHKLVASARMRNSSIRALTICVMNVIFVKRKTELRIHIESNHQKRRKDDVNLLRTLA